MRDFEMWELFCRSNCPDRNEYDSWAFGVDADELAALVLEGKKTATSSAYDLYEADGEKLPEVGEYSIILDSNDNAICVIRTVSVKVAKFCDVDCEFAKKEGEGDRSLEYWKKVHEDFFRGELSEIGKSFDTEMTVVLEEFEVVFS